MLPVSFHRFATVIMLLSLKILLSPITAYPVVLNITTEGGFQLIGLDNKSQRNFGSRTTVCVCSKYTKSCSITFHKLGEYDPDTTALNPKSAEDYTGDYFYQCEFNNQRNEVLCTQGGEEVCPSASCTINIIIDCGKKKPSILIWNSAQNPSVLSFTDEVPVIDCCKPSTTTTELTTIITTSTTFTSTNPTTNPTTTIFTEDSSTAIVGIVYSTSVTLDDVSINSTLSRTSYQPNGFNDTRSGTSSQQNESNTETPLISGQHIGIIVGTAVGAILVTIIVMYICWRLKSRREKNQRNDKAEVAMSLSEHTEESRVNNLREATNTRERKATQTVALVSPLVHSAGVENRLTQPTGDYNYINVNTQASCLSNTTITVPTPSEEGIYQNSSRSEANTETRDNEYSHLGTNNIRQENPYNRLDHQKHSTAIQPNIIPVVTPDRQQDTQYLSKSSYIISAENQISREAQQESVAGENIGLYSQLGESNVRHENMSNTSHNLNDRPVTELGFTQHSGTAKAHSHEISEATRLKNKNLQLFTSPSEYKIMDIPESVPYAYTEVVPKTTREKSDDSNQLQESINQSVLTASSADHLLPRATISCEPGTEISITQETVPDNRVNNEHSAERQAFFNAAYSLHDLPYEGNVSFSVDDATYANVV